MKHEFNDRILDSEAKKLVSQLDRDFAPVEDISVQGNTVDIKAAKAKAGARRHINRTIRICAVAAVLMIGFVFAIFMGMQDVKKDIHFTKEAYLWRINEPDGENIKVSVTVDLDFVKKLEVSKNNLYQGRVTVRDENNNILYDFCHIQLAMGKNNRGSMEVYHDEKECPDGHFDENGYRIGQYGTMSFNDSLNEMVIWVFEGEDRIWIHEDIAGPRTIEYSLAITTSATNREDAIKKTKEYSGISYK
ncbi:MAG: hypothetical protein IKM67_03095 [Clostridia bacterium]|nr:hypothetical protein [Clostridia bacterium]